MRMKILHNEYQLNFRKWSLSLVLLSLFLTAIPMQAENHIPAEKISIEEAFTLIGIEYGVHFNYDRAVVADVEVDYESGQYEKVEDALQSVFSQTHLKYEIFDQRYVAVYRQDREGVESMKKMVSHFQEVISSSENAILRSERRITPPLASLSIKDVFSKRLIFSVSGIVTDQDGEPLIGVNIQVKDSDKGTATDFDGKFSLEDISENAVLIVSYAGYQTQEVVVAGKTNLEIVMTSDSQLLDEVVVVGYGAQKKREVTGAIGSIKMDELPSRPIGNIGQTLYGKIPGVQILQASGRPGASSSIQIRGINSISAGNEPLIVIDGIQMPEFDLNSINMADIESIEILKDAASASIYGSRGANGVVLISTRSGKFEEQSKVQFNYSFGVQQIIKKIDVMNAAEYAQASIDAAQNGWVDDGGDPNAPNTLEARGDYLYMWPDIFETPELLPYDTDWQDEVYRSAPMHDINLRFSGGSKSTNYYFSIGHLNQEGIMITSDYKKTNLNLNINSEALSSKLKYGAYLNTLFDQGHIPDSYTSIGAVQYPAIYPVWGDDGNLGGPQNTQGFENWFAILFRPNSGHPFYNINNNFEFNNLQLIGNAYAEISILDQLIFRTSITTHYRRNDNKDFYAYDHLLGKDYFIIVRSVSVMKRNQRVAWENLLMYNFAVVNHKFNLLGGYEYSIQNKYNLNGERRNYDNDDFQYLTAGQTIYQANDGAIENKLISYFGRINYNFLNRYFMTFQYRYDGSSRFGPENKWGSFPSLSVAWDVSEESFFNQNIFDQLKLRASYGFTDNDNFSEYRWISRMNQSKAAIGDRVVSTQYPSSVENPSLSWERSRQTNIGVDVSFWAGRLSIEGDFYRTLSDDLLLDVPIPSTSGFSNLFTNIGQVENKGLELSLLSRNITTTFNWMTQVTFSTNKSKVLKLGPDGSPIFYNLNGGMQNVNMIGEPMFSFYAYQYEGVYMNQAEIEADKSSYSTAKPGDGKYKDINGDGKISSSDRTIIGKNTPDFIFGITNNFNYGNFDMSFLIQGLYGMDVYDVNFRRSMRYHEGRAYYGMMNDRWRSEDEPGDGYVYRLTTSLDNMVQNASSFWLVDGSYVRLKDLTIGYTIPDIFKSKMNISNLRLYINATNMFTLSSAPINDPENFLGDETSMVRQSHSPYPSSKIYTVGINVEL